MKNVLIVTFNNADNYGAKLQEYALYYFLKKNDYNVCVLNYNNKLISKQYELFNIFGNTLEKKIKSVIKNILFFSKRKERKKRFKVFDMNFIEYSKKCNYFDDFQKIIKYFDVAIAGSDQIWNPDITNGFDPIYTLNFKNDSVRKISYAASFGTYKNIIEHKDYVRKMLNNYSYISIREKTSEMELKKIISRDVETVLDPTLLLNQYEWHTIINDENNNKNYIFTYMVENDESFIEYVNTFSKEKKVGILHFDLKNKKYNKVEKNYYSSGPKEFVEALSKSKYVITTSFHATVFSIIFHKKFCVFPHKKTGERVVDLLKDFGLENRIFNPNFKMDDDIDWDRVDRLLNEKRHNSKKWIKKALGD